MKQYFIFTVSIIFLVSAIVLPIHCFAMANPASVNCTDKGGTLYIEKRGDLGEYGICKFEDNRQCEEWAMFRGECPTGGVKITGYRTPAAIFCVITGGKYSSTGQDDTIREEGICTFKNNICNALEYYNGRCNKK